MDTILFIRATINGVPVQATMRVTPASAHELRVRLFWRWYEAQQELETERLWVPAAPGDSERKAA